MCVLESDRDTTRPATRVYYFVNNIVCILRGIAYYVAFIRIDY